MTEDASRPKTDEAFELDLENASDLEEAMQDAVAALDGDEVEDDGAEDETAEASSTSDLGEQLAASEARYLRLLADFENFRKRSEREREAIQRYAMQEPLRVFLEAIDNVERALAAGGAVDDLKSGLDMTLRGLGESLRKFGVEPVETIGQPFDPTVHEAVSRRDDPDVEEATVVAEMQRGYRLHDRLLRPAMVVVAMPAAAETAS